ncbi:DUF979 domain-containing protein [Clostridium sp.]|uniref:DUF979 domain-containing protein n=1 Tax=Clostridium sp. TaxID=1506 RepID=UPI003F2E0ED4
MDSAQISKILLELFYIMVGALMATTSAISFKDKNHKTRLGTSLFWAILAVIFMFGSYIPSVVTGILLICIAVLTATKQVNIGSIKALDLSFSDKESKKLRNKIFIPSVVIAVVALSIAQFTSLAGTAAIGIAAIVAVAITFIITKAKPKEFVEDSNRMLQAVGATAILPQLLAALGSLFAAAGVGEIISKAISGVIPEGNILFGVIAYCVGMALFTAIMGNAFAAFSVITLGIGVPFVFAQGGNVIIASTLALTAGYCGTLLTPMAANFNIMPAALLEMKDENAVIKHQAPVALTLLVIHIALMYFLAF